jgi:hypothetical protein
LQLSGTPFGPVFDVSGTLLLTSPRKASETFSVHDRQDTAVVSKYSVDLHRDGSPTFV